MNLASLKSAFIGLDTPYIRSSGEIARRYYFDTAASSLMCRPAWDVMQQFLQHYANTHSQLHSSAKVASREFEWAKDTVLKWLDAEKKDYACVFSGSGATSCLNRIADLLDKKFPDKHTVIASLMEHHSNDLPHRLANNKVIHAPLVGSGRDLGVIDVDQLRSLVEEHQADLKYIAVSHASNVTGVVNPIHEIAAIAHAANVPIVVDGAQGAPHLPVVISHSDPNKKIDAYVFSGHKCYVPGSPGAMVLNRQLFADLPPSQVGGGMVSHVGKEQVDIIPELPGREEAGTPNIVGAVGLAAALHLMMSISMESLHREEQVLTKVLWEKLAALDDVILYGPAPTDVERTGTISFNIKDCDHGYVAAALNDFFGIQVRNECFCAHPYVRALIVQDLWALDFAEEITDAEMQAIVKRKQGMVRMSLGIYNTETDIAYFIDSVQQFVASREQWLMRYDALPNGDYQLKPEFDQSHQQVTFRAQAILDSLLHPAS